MLRALELIDRHASALFRHDDGGRLLCVNDVAGRPAPRFYLGRTPEGNVWRFRHDLPPALVVELEALSRSEPAAPDPATPPVYADRYRTLLAPVAHEWAGPAFSCPSDVPTDGDTARVTSRQAEVLRGAFDDWIDSVAPCQPFVVAFDRGRPVALCASVRVTPTAHEAGVETLPAARGRGHAGVAVAAWAGAVRELGALPLYSTSWDNARSLRVAQKLGLVRYGSDFHLT